MTVFLRQCQPLRHCAARNITVLPQFQDLLFFFFHFLFLFKIDKSLLTDEVNDMFRLAGRTISQNKSSQSATSSSSREINQWWGPAWQTKEEAGEVLVSSPDGSGLTRFHAWPLQGGFLFKLLNDSISGVLSGVCGYIWPTQTEIRIPCGPPTPTPKHVIV